MKSKINEALKTYKRLEDLTCGPCLREGNRESQRPRKRRQTDGERETERERQRKSGCTVPSNSQQKPSSFFLSFPCSLPPFYLFIFLTHLVSIFIHQWTKAIRQLCFPRQMKVIYFPRLSHLVTQLCRKSLNGISISGLCLTVLLVT